MPYPERLLPEPSDDFIEELNPNEHLCRWTRPEFQLKDKDGKLTALSIEEKRLFHYSVNKIPRAEIEDVFIEFTEKEPFNQPWSKGVPPLNIREEDFIRQKNRGWFLIRIGDIHRHTGHYPFPANNEDYDFEFLVKVVHVPLRANFMHFELHIFDEYGNLIPEVKKKKWRKIIVAELRQHLIRVVKFEIKK